MATDQERIDFLLSLNRDLHNALRSLCSAAQLVEDAWAKIEEVNTGVVEALPD